MKHSYRWSGLATGLGLGSLAWSCLLWSSPAWSATWPVWRGSKERTAVAHGHFGEGTPQVTFRMSLGGDTTRTAVFPPDMPGKMLSAVGGRVRAIDVVTGGVDWESPMLQELTLAGSADLDGDGASEVVAFTRRQAYVFSGTDGSVLWQSVLGEHSTIGAVRVADVSGDGLAEVLIDDCATCGVPGPLVAEVVSFGQDESGALLATAKWTVLANEVPKPYHQGTDAVLLGLAGGRPALGLTTLEDFRVLDGETGVTTVVVPRGDLWFAQSSAMVGGPEQVLLLRAQGNANGALPPAVMSLNVSPELGQGSVGWQYAGDLYATLDLSNTAATDLDGNGDVEVAVSELATDGNWSFVILDAVSGALELRVPDWKLEGVLPDVRVGDLPALIVSGGQGLALATYSNGEFTRVGEPLSDWETTSTPAANPILVAPIRPALAKTGSGSDAALLLGKAPAPGAGGGRYATLGWASITDSGLHVTRTYTPKLAVTAVYAADGATRPYSQFAIGTTDGAITVLDRQLQPSNGSLYTTRSCFWEDEKTRYEGVAIGGRQPGRGNLISRAEEQSFLVVPNTAAGTVAADARAASLVTPPQQLWSAPALLKPSVFETDLGVVVAGVDDQRLALRDALSGDVVASAPLTQSELDPFGSPHNEPLLLGHGDGNQVITLDWALPGNQISQRAFNWTAEGLTAAWSSEPMLWGGGFFSSGGRYKFDESTPTTDILVMATNGSTYYRRADTGELTTKTLYTGHYTLPIFADFTGDQQTDILFQSGFVSPWLYGPNWAPLWQKPGPLPTYTVAGALIPCAAGARYITPHLRASRFLVHDGVTGTVVRDAVAASGALFETEASAQAAGAMAGFLSNVSVIEAASGEILVLFGSTDGYLYAVNGCDDLDLAWALNVGTPLGEPSIGDWDDDGEEELLIGAASGHVLGVDFGRLAAPSVQASVSRNAARVNWSPVEGASSYEYALVEPDGSPVWNPPYRRTRALHARIDLDRTLPGRPFRVAVRARTSTARGNDGLSPVLSLTDTRAPHVRAEWDARHGVWFGAADNAQLDHYLVWEVDATGKRTLLSDGFVSGQFAHRGEFLGAEPSPRAVAVVVTVVDAAGNAAEMELTRPRPKRPHWASTHWASAHHGHSHHGRR